MPVRFSPPRPLWDGTFLQLLHCFFFLHANLIQVAIAPGFHLFPFRTEKLSPVTPMVLRNSGRVGSRRLQWKSSVTNVSRGTFRFYTSRPCSRPLPFPRLPTECCVTSSGSASSGPQEVLHHTLTKCCVRTSRSTLSYPHGALRYTLTEHCVRTSGSAALHRNNVFALFSKYFCSFAKENSLFVCCFAFFHYICSVLLI